MRRKVVKHGLSTFIVSLPHAWAKRYNIQKGTEVEVREEGPTLLISTERKSERLETVADITGLDRTSIMYVIRGLYRRGYDSVRLTFSKPEVDYQRTGKTVPVLSVIHAEVNRLIGFEILEEHEGSCLVADLQGSEPKEFDSVLRRLFLLIADAAKDLERGARTADKTLLATIDEKHDTITKFASYCLRLLNKQGYADPRTVPYYYHIVACLDRITDDFKYAARNLLLHGRAAHHATSAILAAVAQSLDQYRQLFYKYDNALVVSINAERYEAEKRLRSLPKGMAPLEIVAAAGAFHVLEALLDLIEARAALEP